MTTIRIVHQLGRTGSTLLNRCLGSMDGINVLSQVHPRQGAKKCLKQAWRWFSLIGWLDAPRIMLLLAQSHDKAFAKTVLWLSKRARSRGTYLIVRDWTHIDFIGVPYVQDPPQRLVTAELLGRHATLRQAFMTRHPIDQFLSSRKRGRMAQMPLEPFLKGCAHFAEVARAHGFVRYEDLIANPDKTVQEICARLDVPFTPDFRQRWSRYTTVDGDNTGTRNISRAWHRDEFVVLPPHECDPELLKAFHANPDYWKILELLDYKDRARAPEHGVA
jgi:hypothetical protein